YRVGEADGVPYYAQRTSHGGEGCNAVYRDKLGGSMSRKWFIGVTQVGRAPGHPEDQGLYEAKGETGNGSVLDIPPAKGWRSLPGT
ncbi:unnamed protein product, partial [Laminaria digitata]